MQSNCAELALVLVDTPDDKRDGKRGDSAGLRQGPNSLLFRAWSRLDRSLNAHRGDAFDLCEVGPMLKDVPTVEVRHSEGARNDEMLQTLRAANLDVIIVLNGEPSAEDISKCARYGAWLLPGSKQSHELASPMFWAAYRGDPVLETALCAATASQGTQVIYHSYSATNVVSPYLGQDSVLWKNGEFVARRLSDLQRYGWDYARTLDGTHVELASSRRDPLPDNLTTARFLLRWFTGALDYEFKQKLRKEQWFIAYRRNAGKVPISARDMREFNIVTPPRDRFYADPFVIRRNDHNYIFFEDYRYKQKKGLISCMEVDKTGECSKPEVVLETPYHLSYPFVFEHQGEMFLMPETRSNRSVELYRAVDFPRRWVLEKVLLKDLPAVDPTIFVHDGKVWLFVGGMVDNVSTNDELFLFFANSLFGEWTPHQKNPVVSDVRTARPAGKLFFHNGQLIRPSQNCSTRYGFGVSFNRVDTLTSCDYREVPVGNISAEWRPGNLGTHTWNQNEDFQVVDGRTLIFK